MKKGKPQSDSTKFKISLSNKGKIAWNKGKKLTEKQKEKMRGPRICITGENNYQWKGQFASYSAIHSWMVRNYGKPTHCENCKRLKTKTDYKIFDWANISGKYIRKREDWKMLCKSCHKLFDNKKRLCKVKRKPATQETKLKISQSLKKLYAQQKLRFAP